jgi:hypothetical protein
MAFLYINPKGQPWRQHSYSSGLLYDKSPLAYAKQKIEGYKVKDTLARFQYGKAIEDAVQHHHEHNGEGAVQHFIEKWMPNSALDLIYTKVEKDWNTCLQNGIEHIKLYILRQPELPIPLRGQTIWQKLFAKEVYPGDERYGEIEDTGKLDIISFVSPIHPMLPKLDWKPEYGPLRPLIIDIKAMAADFPQEYGIAAYDAQLRRYSWLSGIRDVALLVFVKKSRSMQKGSSVTLLEDAGHFKAGQEAVIAQMADSEVVLVANDFLIEEMERAQGKKKNKKGEEATDQTNEAKERRDKWLSEFGVRAPISAITKQRLQFNAGYVTIESANEAGQIAGRQIVNIVNSWHQKSWPSNFGIRFPKDDRQDPYFRAFVLNDEAYRKENFIKSDEITMDDLFADIDDENEQA